MTNMTRRHLVGAAGLLAIAQSLPAAAQSNSYSGPDRSRAARATSRATDLTDAELEAMFERCSNTGRWGTDDELGTLNYMTPERRVAAAKLVKTGEDPLDIKISASFEKKSFVLKDFSALTKPGTIRASGRGSFTRARGPAFRDFSFECPSLDLGRVARLVPALAGFRLGGRLRRHLRPDKALRWHVDHLTTAGRIFALGLAPGGQECALVDGLGRRPGVTVPLAGFGSSDCARCPAHLLRIERPVDPRHLAEASGLIWLDGSRMSETGARR